MTVTALVNGVQQTASVSMQVVPCPAGDSLIDNPVARAMGTATWQAMNTTGSPELRVERGAYMFDSSGVYVYRLSPADPLDNACKNLNSPASPYPGRPVVGIHGHGFGKTANGQDVELAPPCAWPPNLGPNQVAKYKSGPSGQDWHRALNDSMPLMVMDKDSVYRIYPQAMDSIAGPDGAFRFFPKDGWESKYKSASRVSGACVRM